MQIKIRAEGVVSNLKDILGEALLSLKLLFAYHLIPITQKYTFVVVNIMILLSKY